MYRAAHVEAARAAPFVRRVARAREPQLDEGVRRQRREAELVEKHARPRERAESRGDSSIRIRSMPPFYDYRVQRAITTALYSSYGAL